jgi:hypothetical protein
MLALVEGVPAADKPEDPSKDSHDGPVLLEVNQTTGLTTFVEAGFCWIDRGFRRFWELNPEKAVRIRAGEQTSRASDK